MKSVMPTALEISVQCCKLSKKDALGESDAFCVLFRVPNGSVNAENPKRPSRLPSSQEQEVGRSEVIYDSKDPDFTTPFRVDYHFEEEQTYVLRVYDEDQKGASDLSKHDYLGGTAFRLGQLLGAKGNSLARPLQMKKGYVILQAEEVSSSSSRDTLELQLAGNNLKNTDGMFGLSDPFFILKRINPDGKTWNTVWKSDVVKDNLNPVWDVAQIPLQVMCNGDMTRRIQIQIMDYDSLGTHDDMGCVETTVQELIDHAPKVYDIMSVSRKKAKKKGTLSVQKASIIQQPTMLDYTSGGCEISLMVAVDFTASNLIPNNPKSLHYRGNGKNEYQSAIEKIGTILQDYDTNKQFPMWGFGAQINGVPQPCFEMGLGEEVHGVHGLLTAYEETFNLPGFGLYGPTNFAPVLRNAIQSSIQNVAHGEQCYSVLVILTDGEITDFKETVDLICKAAHEAPLSIVIIGVGQANFDAMEFLDGDGGRLKNSIGVPAPRDIVQFVPFRRFSGSTEQLAQETLREIPGHLVQYYLKRNIRPNPPIPAPVFTEEEIFVSWDGIDEDIDVKAEIVL